MFECFYSSNKSAVKLDTDSTKSYLSILTYV